MQDRNADSMVSKSRTIIKGIVSDGVETEIKSPLTKIVDL